MERDDTIKAPEANGANLRSWHWRPADDPPETSAGSRCHFSEISLILAPFAPEAFSLVEVVVALGLVSFCLLAIIGLLPIGLGAVKNAREESAAASTMAQIAGAIRAASSTNATAYSALGPYTNLTWSIGGAPVSLDYTNLSGGGVPTTLALNQRLRAHIALTPPASPSSPGTAFISVAWPQHAQWNGSASNWSNAQGTISTWLVFLPNQ